MKQIVIRFGLLAACLMILMKMGEYTRMSGRLSDEIFFSLFAVLFLAFGYVMNQFIQKKKIHKETLPNEVQRIDQAKISELKISRREYQVLELIHLGHSNQEISKQLFISESTVKSHVSSLLQKLDAKRRTQAIKTAKELQIL
ncbi:MAG: LuxR C-terminal-related transcriptional regulator [Bacteroidota bacterium]